MDHEGVKLTELLLFDALPILVVCAVVVVTYLALVAYVHLRARHCYELYLQMSRQAEDMRKAKEGGEEAPLLESVERVADLLKSVLEEEKILPSRDSRPPR